MKNYVIGVDYGTDSVRSVIVDTSDGKEIASSLFYYPRWKQGLYCKTAEQQFRQHPLDYIKIHRSEKTCATGAAMFAATMAGIYPSVEEAMNKKGTGFDITYFPSKGKNKIYEKRYEKYCRFATFNEGLS